jgi:NAD(P)-dependent dehydrogenase (short-subunit alcohol dehydrogenase family)
MPEMGLKDKVAIVTGAGSRADGIGNGRAAAILLAREGVKVALIDATTANATATKAMIDKEGGTSMVVEADVTVPASCEAAVKKTVAAWGRVDFLVNNVGVGGTGGNAVDLESGRRRDCSRRPPTPPCIGFPTRRFMIGD